MPSRHSTPLPNTYKYRFCHSVIDIPVLQPRAVLLHVGPIDQPRISQCTIFQFRLHVCRYSNFHLRRHPKRMLETVWHITRWVYALRDPGTPVPRGAAKTVASEMVSGTWSAKFSTFATICNNVTLAVPFSGLLALFTPEM
jgi:hypothetical protein